MSAYHQLFVRTDKPEHEVIDDLRSATGAAIGPSQTPPNAIAYVGKVANTVIEVELRHDFEEDRDLDFDAYPIVVTIRYRVRTDRPRSNLRERHSTSSNKSAAMRFSWY